MPIYEYECLTCGITFEKRQSFSDELKAECPNGHKETRRLLAAPAIVFKGSGFYVTDNKSKNGANGPSNRGEKSEKTESSSDTKSESKPEEAKSEKSKEKA